MASIYVEPGVTDVKVQVVDLDYTYERDDRYIRWTINGQTYTQRNIDAYIDETDVYTISGLSGGTTYTITAKIYYTEWESDWVTVYELKRTTGTSNSYINASFDVLYDDYEWDADTGVVLPGNEVDLTWKTAGLTGEEYCETDGYAFRGRYMYYITIQYRGDNPKAYWKYRYEIITTEEDNGDYVFVDPVEPPSVRFTTKTGRPAKFYWTYSKTSGGDFNLTATEWNDCMANINAVRAYKGLSSLRFTTAVKGQPFTANMYNEAVEAIWGIDNGAWGAYIDTHSKGDVIYASYLNNLRDELNAIV